MAMMLHMLSKINILHSSIYHKGSEISTYGIIEGTLTNSQSINYSIAPSLNYISPFLSNFFN